MDLEMGTLDSLKVGYFANLKVGTSQNLKDSHMSQLEARSHKTF